MIGNVTQEGVGLSVDQPRDWELALVLVGEGEERLVDLLHLGGVLHRPGVPLGRRQRRQQQAHEQGDDGDHHQQFDKGKAFDSIHGLVSNEGMDEYGKKDEYRTRNATAERLISDQPEAGRHFSGVWGRCLPGVRRVRFPPSLSWLELNGTRSLIPKPAAGGNHCRLLRVRQLSTCAAGMMCRRTRRMRAVCRGRMMTPQSVMAATRPPV